MAEAIDSPSTKPYLVRAIHEWCSDSGLTPYLAVSVTENVRVPREHVRNGEIVLNISMLASDKLLISNDAITFQARFSGRVHDIYVPMENIVAIYAKETGNGMAFDVPKPLAEPASKHPASDSAAGVGTLSPVSVVTSESSGSEEPPPRTSGGRPKLTRVK